MLTKIVDAAAMRRAWGNQPTHSYLPTWHFPCQHREIADGLLAKHGLPWAAQQEPGHDPPAELRTRQPLGAVLLQHRPSSRGKLILMICNGILLNRRTRRCLCAVQYGGFYRERRRRFFFVRDTA
jgi:hypothetical protein